MCLVGHWEAWIYLARAKMALGSKREAYRSLQEARFTDIRPFKQQHVVAVAQPVTIRHARKRLYIMNMI